MEKKFRPTLRPFLDTTTPFDEARYVVFGAPLDATASQRSGSRFAPDALRQASLYMETYSLRTDLDLTDISVADVGDLRGLESPEISLEKISAAAKAIGGSEKTPIMLGGEHTVTLGGLRAVKPDLVIVFDAHMDLRESLLGLSLSHGTFMRRAMEELDFKLIILGCRAVSREEMEFAEANEDRVAVVTAAELLRGGKDAGVKALRSWHEEASSTYISVDMDVVDPAQAPAVGNPSPEGIGITLLLDLIHACADECTRGFDLTEVTPHFDSGLTATQAAYVTLETIYALEAASRRQPR
jgi:agmatinase